MKLKIKYFNGIPIYYAAKKNNLPIILVLHGFTSSSLRQEERTNILTKLYEKEFCVVAIEAVLHGAREGAEDFLQKEYTEKEDRIFEIIEKTAGEIDGIVKFIKIMGIGDNGKIGLTGISMGGFITFKSVILTDEIKAFVPMVASPYFEEFAEYSLKKREIKKSDNYTFEFEKLREQEPFNNIEKFILKKIFIMAGKYDEVVPYYFSEKGYEELKKVYIKFKKENGIKYKLYDAEHGENENMIEDMINWFKEVL